MSLDDMLCLSQAGRPIRLFPLTDRPVEVGSSSRCDLAVPCDEVPPRAWLVQPASGSVFAYDLVAAPGIGAPRVMPIGERVPLGGDFQLARIKGNLQSPAPGETEILRRPCVERLELALVGAAGAAGVRTVRVGQAPISVGCAPDNLIKLNDRAVSRYHCRIEPSPSGLRVRDLDSSNGTWVDGARVERHELRTGSRIRVGRTALRLIELERNRPQPFVAISKPMESVMADVDRFARLPWPVLVCGETGVGKEVVARALHERGPRRRGPFVAINAGGFTRELIESELFGHERGAFTGAVQTRRGAFEQAHGGTLFLDEIAELPLVLQTRLLRVLETWRIRRLGSETERPVDVRLICATHANLRKQVANGTFRPDLFYRVHRLVIEVPPLRARRADLQPLAAHFLRLMRSEIGPQELTDSAAARLAGHPWLGNVRELRNVLELAAIDCEAGIIDRAAVERAIRRIGELSSIQVSPDAVREALEHHGGNVSAAARALGVPRSTLRDRLKLVSNET